MILFESRARNEATEDSDRNFPLVRNYPLVRHILTMVSKTSIHEKSSH